MTEDKYVNAGTTQENDSPKSPTPPENIAKNPGEPVDNKDYQGERKNKQVHFDTKIEGNVKKIEQAEKIININKEFKKSVLPEGKSIEIETFSSSRIIPLQKQDIAALQDFFVYPETKLGDLTAALSTHRMLLLTGEAESGKYLTTKYLSFRMIQQTNIDYEVAIVDPLEQKINIDPLELFTNQKFLKKILKKKILIFKDVLSKKNQGLIDFFLSCSSEQTNFLSGKLKEVDAFVLFTADNETFRQFPLPDLNIKKDICTLDLDLLKKGFDIKLKLFCNLSLSRDYTQASLLFEGRKQEIVKELGRMSKVALFIEHYLDKILKQEKSIDEAIEEAKNVENRLRHWFLNELGMNKKYFETWTFALCLALFNYSSYADFNEIHCEITAILLEKLDPFQTLKNFTFTLSERELLEKCHAQIKKDMMTYADRIEFCNYEYQKVLLEILLDNNRKVLLHIVSFLREYVEEHFRPEQRRFAAISLARIGQLDPEVITLPIIDKWANMESNFHRANVGYLYEGIIASNDDIYLTYCMRKLKHLAFSDDVYEQWTAIAAFKQIGLYDLEFTMKELRKIQEEIIERMIKKKDVLDIVYSNTDLLKEQDVLTNLDRIYEETGYLLSIIRYSIVALSINLNLIDVLEELRKWVDSGNRNSRVNVVLFFMGTDGILQELEDREVVYLSKDEEDKKEKLHCSLLLDHLGTGEETVKKMARFLKALYKKCFSEFRADVSNTLKKLLFDHMKEWTQDSLDNTKVNNTLKNLFVKFFHLGDDDLKDSFWESITNWKAPKGKEEKFTAFIEAITQQFYGMDR